MLMCMRGVVIVGMVLGLPLGVAAEDLPAHTFRTLPPSQMPLQELNASAPTLLGQLSRTYTTPKAIAAWLHRDFTFRRDEDQFGEIDRWQAPEEFAVSKIGDCEDYALLAQALLRRNGIEAFVLSLFGEEGYAHTVSVFVDAEGRYNVINQDQVRYYRAKSLEDLASAIYPAWTFGGIAERDGTRGRLVREIINEHPAPAFEELASVF